MLFESDASSKGKSIPCSKKRMAMFWGMIDSVVLLKRFIYFSEKNYRHEQD